jgi:glycosyltransferase involved in cell wall biosynthesis
MRILITSIVDLKKSQHNRPHHFLRYLSKKHDITVLSINDWWKGKQDNLEFYSREFDDIFERIKNIYLTKNKINPILQEVLSKKKVKEVCKEGFDVHLNYNTFYSGYEAAKRIPTAFDIADDLSAMIRKSPQITPLLRPLGGFLGDIIMQKNISKSKKISVTTDVLLKTYNIPQNKSILIPNGVNTKLFRNYKNAKNELGLNNFIVGYVGVLREWVDLSPVFHALKKLKDIKMLVVGSEGRYNENIELAKKIGVTNKVIFTGMVPYSQVPRYISAMDICLIPFKKDAISENALPLKLFEYMACEKPVISTELPVIKNVIGDKIFYVTKKSGYKEKIKDLYIDEKLRQEMGKNGSKFVIKNYNWEKIVKDLEDVLEGIAK